MSNLDAIRKKLEEKSRQPTTISVPDAPKKKAKKDPTCPQCNNRSVMKGFCMVCGYEEPRE